MIAALFVGLGLAAPDAKAPAANLTGDAMAESVAKQSSTTGPTAESMKTAQLLDMDPTFLVKIQTGLEKIYERRYDDALAHFVSMEEEHPRTGLGPLSETVIWQARMLENFDYRYEKEYWAASRRARKELDDALSVPGNEAWEHLASAAVVGMESIFSFRRRRYLNALSLAFTAMGHIESSREAAPDFVDLRLADGMYLYWRTVVTERSSMLPDFGDHKAAGIAHMRDVESNGVFIRPLATLALAFTFLEDGQSNEAKAACLRNRELYPNNVINNLVTTMVLVKKRSYDEALAMTDRIHASDPDNVYAHYWRGVARLKKGQLEPAKESFETYLATQHLEKYQRAAANYRLGQLNVRAKEYKIAADHFQRAIKIDDHKSSKAALDALKTARKEGRLDW